MLGYGKLLTGVESIFWSLGNRPKDGPDLYDPCFLLLFDATIILQTFLYDGSISYEWSLL